jgi:transcription elongation factor Elf1
MARTTDPGAYEDEDEGKKSGASLGTRRRFEEFECPTCSANNPFDEFGNNDEVLCSWCGLSFKAQVDEEGNLRLKEL